VPSHDPVSAPRRGLDWPSAWSALVPVYALAAVLHAIQPLFAALVWVIFVIYGRKVLDGARLAQDPWRGRGSPRPYLTSLGLALVVHLVSFAVALGGGGNIGTVVTAVVSLPIVLGLAALFVARTAPPGVRDERAWLRLGFGAEVAGGLIPSAYLFASLPTTGSDPLAASLAALGLTVVSIAAFFWAPRAAKRRAPSVARKVARE